MCKIVGTISTQVLAERQRRDAELRRQAKYGQPLKLTLGELVRKNQAR